MMLPMTRTQKLRADLLAGLTVALVAIPQCMAFATICDLPPAVGLHTAMIMGLVGSFFSGLAQLNVGPAVTVSTLVYAVLATVNPATPAEWALGAAWLAILSGLLMVLAAQLYVGQFVRFVPRSVIVGLTAGTGLLITVSQLGPFLGVRGGGGAALAVVLWNTLKEAPHAHWPAIVMASTTAAGVLLGRRWLGPRFPTPFVMIIAGAVAFALLERGGRSAGLESIGQVPRELPTRVTSLYTGPVVTDLFAGAAAIALSSIIQTLAVAKAVARRNRQPLDSRREVMSLGAAHLAAGVLGGFPGAASFARTALNDMAGAATRLAGVVAALSIGLISLAFAPLAHYITKPAIAGLLMATVVHIVDWDDLIDVLRRGRADRLVLLTTVLSLWVIPIHWSILIGLAMALAIFLRRVSRLHLFEMVAAAEGRFREHAIDDQTGGSQITMLQVEGPLFFAHADEMEATLSRVFGRGPRAVILRMRRTQHIDFSVISAMNDVVRDYLAAGGTFIVCGLTPPMHKLLRGSALGETIGRSNLIRTTREVFGSAHLAMRMARQIVDAAPDLTRPLLRASSRDEPPAIDSENIAAAQPVSKA